MGTGKTSIGKLLAKRLGFNFVDTDQKIEEIEGHSISKIFEENGEMYFREKEKEIVNIITKDNNTVIATGGGIVKDRDNIKKLSDNGIIISLTASIDAILARTAVHGTRPLLDNACKDRRMTIEKILLDREVLYGQAAFSVDTSERSPWEIVEIIIQFLKNTNNR